MDILIFDWLLDFTLELTRIGNWLVTPLPYINASPLGMFTIAFLNILIGIHLLRLFVGG